MPIVRAATLQETLHLKEVPANGQAWHRLLLAGLPYRCLVSTAKTLGVKEAVLALHIGLTPRTQAARKKAKRLTAAESDLVYALARAYVRAASFMGPDKAAAWLMSDVEILKGIKPFDFIRSRLGTEYVMTLLERLRPATQAEISLALDEPEEDEEDA